MVEEKDGNEADKKQTILNKIFDRPIWTAVFKSVYNNPELREKSKFQKYFGNLPGNPKLYPDGHPFLFEEIM